LRFAGSNDEKKGEGTKRVEERVEEFEKGCMDKGRVIS
jgi:hypothetical protein